MSVRGSVDAISSAEVRGWAYAPGRAEPVLVQAVLNHEILGEGVANLHRADLAAAGLGDGNSGYALKLFRPIDPLYLPFVTVKVDGGDCELPRGSLFGFAEYFAALARAHPAAGRSRSVLGGLWTSRTDAAALLRGKADIGQIGPDTAALIAPLIHAGYAVLPASAAAGMAEMLEESATLALLRAVLEDNPLAAGIETLDGETALAQPSAASPAPSPAECLAVVASTGEAVLDIVRDSHLLPEFTPAGASRWTGGAAAGLDIASAHGLLDRVALPPGALAVIGPGTIYRVGGPALRALVLPARQLPLSLAADRARREIVRPSGVRIWP